MNALLRERGLKLDITPEALDYLAEVGWDPDFGARPLKRAIQREVQDPLALKVISGEARTGETIRVSRGADRLVFEPEAAPEAVNP